MKKNKAAEIKVLSQIQHVRQNRFMYIGDSKNPNHLITEILDNSLDELLNGFAETIYCKIDGEAITIADDGRGIPIHPVKLENGELEDSIITMATKLFSGSKFDENAYKVHIGQHGIGTSVVNFLSDYMIVETGGWKYNFINGEFDKKEKSDHKYSTVIIFKPSKQYFEEDINKNEIIDRLKLIKARLENKKIIYNDEEISGITYNNYIREKLNINNEIPLFSVDIVDKENTVKVSFTYDFSEKNSSATSLGDVNLKNSGGSYLNTVQTLISNSIFPLIPKNYILDKYDILYKIKIYTSVILGQPKYDAQVKNRLVTDLSKLIAPLGDKIAKLYKSNEFIQKSIESINENKILRTNAAKKTRTGKKRKSIENPIIDSIKKPGERIFIVEGESAGGTLIRCRNKDTDAVMPLKGKVLNVEKSTLDKILANNEIKYLFESLGVDPSKKNITDINYKNIILMGDADPDGGHITVLLEFIMFKFLPEIIKQGRVKILLAPLFGIVDKNKKTKLIYSTNPPQIKSDEKLFRFKGLGEMNMDQLKTVIDKGKYYTLKFPEDGGKIVNDIFSNVATKIKEMNNLDNNMSVLWNECGK